ncbi:MAG TPA: glutamate formimidoyltransferase [Bryobacteraceae bacterium]|nr:glutamate formimidoyltransferase [Bryobacteraceae bacterium]
MIVASVPTSMIECVPNFSEGRDAAVIHAIVDAIRSSPGVLLLGWESDPDHNRSVVTFAGSPDDVVEAAVRGAGKAAECIDLRGHRGVHPRAGAADVIPFIPLEGSTMSDCVAAAHRAGRCLWERFGVPVYFYEAAAKTPGRQRLEKVRRQEFDGLPPDIGTMATHPSAGASMVGARGILIAYNVDLETSDASIARAIARRIRESSGGFPYVKAMGLYLESRGCAQVSMNLTRYAETPLNEVLRAIDQEAARFGARAGSGELIGFLPRRAFEIAPEFFKRAGNFDESRIIENRIRQLLDSK